MNDNVTDSELCLDEHSIHSINQSINQLITQLVTRHMSLSV